VSLHCSPKEVAESLTLWRNRVNRELTYLNENAPTDLVLSQSKCAVFVESKRTPFSEFAVRNVVHNLGSKWGLCLYVDKSMINWAQKLTKDWGDVMVLQIGTPSGSTSAKYLNQKMREPEFWQSLPAEHLLIFDSGTMMRDKIPPQFLEYDYIGSPWLETVVSPWCRVGGGKFSLRRRSAMLDVINRCNTNFRLIKNEDVFFSVAMHLSRDRYAIPTPEVAAGFCVEQQFHPNPIALHKAWMNLKQEDLSALLG